MPLSCFTIAQSSYAPVWRSSMWHEALERDGLAVWSSEKHFASPFLTSQNYLSVLERAHIVLWEKIFRTYLCSTRQQISGYISPLQLVGHPCLIECQSKQSQIQFDSERILHESWNHIVEPLEFLSWGELLVSCWLSLVLWRGPVHFVAVYLERSDAPSDFEDRQ